MNRAIVEALLLPFWALLLSFSCCWSCAVVVVVVVVVDVDVVVVVVVVADGSCVGSGSHNRISISSKVELSVVVRSWRLLFYFKSSSYW